MKYVVLDLLTPKKEKKKKKSLEIPKPWSVVLGTENSFRNKTDKNDHLHGTYILAEGNKHQQ